MFACLASIGAPLNELVRNILLLEACDMAKRGEESRRILSDFCIGQISSDFVVCCLGTIIGVAFSAEIDGNQGKTNVSFIVSLSAIAQGGDELLMNGEWLSPKQLKVDFDQTRMN